MAKASDCFCQGLNFGFADVVSKARDDEERRNRVCGPFREDDP